MVRVARQSRVQYLCHFFALIKPLCQCEPLLVMGFKTSRKVSDTAKRHIGVIRANTLTEVAVGASDRAPGVLCTDDGTHHNITMSREILCGRMDRNIHTMTERFKE